MPDLRYFNDRKGSQMTCPPTTFGDADTEAFWVDLVHARVGLETYARLEAGPWLTHERGDVIPDYSPLGRFRDDVYAELAKIRDACDTFLAIRPPTPKTDV